MIRVAKREKGVALKDKGKSAREGATSHKMTSRPTGIDWTLSSKKPILLELFTRAQMKGMSTKMYALR